MTKKNFELHLEIYRDDFCESTSVELQMELVKKIANHKTLANFDKLTALKQYADNLITNGVLYERLCN